MMEPVFNSSQTKIVKDYLVDMIRLCKQPSARELLKEIEGKFGWKVRWSICDILEELIDSTTLTRSERAYFLALIGPDSEDSIIHVLTGQTADTKIIQSTIDMLIEEGQRYRNSADFIEMVEFMAKFRRYSPYNNMLVKIQNPHCSFYATRSDWNNLFKRHLKEDAKPMIILAPRHPVMLVYGLDETEGGKVA